MENEGCSPEGIIHHIEIFKGFILEVQRETAVPNPVLMYILPKLWADTMSWRKIAGRGMSNTHSIVVKAVRCVC